MDTQRLLACGARGVHLLFDRDVIAEAFEQRAEDLRAVVDEDLDGIQTAVERLLELPDAGAGRTFIEHLPRPVQHVLVLLYFELLDGSLRRGPLTLH
jgi:hypothetical protein